MLIKKMYLYDDDPNVTLTAYVLDDSPEMLDGGKRPGILVCPGGAYMFCSDREAEPVALRFAAMGYHAFVLRYSVYSNSGNRYPIPGRTPVYEKSVFPGPALEIGKSMLLIREHAEEWKVDMDKIILTGYSAGANNCAEYAVYWDKPVIYEALGVKPELLRPAAAVLGYGVFDYAQIKEKLEEKGDAEAAAVNAGYNLAFFGTPDPDQEFMDRLSPAKLVSGNTPPMFLWSTSEDNTVPVEQTFLMALAMAKKGIPCETHVFENGMHGLSLADQSVASAREQILPDVARWIPLAETWMKKRFALDMPDKCKEWHMPEE